MSRIWTPPTAPETSDGIDLGEEFDAIDCSRFIDDYVCEDEREVKTIGNRCIAWGTAKRGSLKDWNGPRYTCYNYQPFEVPRIRAYIRQRLAMIVAVSLANDTKE